MTLNDLSNVGQFIGGIAAAIALFGVWWQVWESRRNQETATAKQALLSFVELAFENPTYAKPPSPLPTGSSDKWDPVKYDLFVTHMLWTMEEIYTLFPNDPDWQETVLSHVAPHLDYITSGPFDRTSYKRDFLHFIGAPR